MNKIKNVIVFASYFEAENLEIILDHLSSKLSSEDVVVIADDSGPEYRLKLEDTCNKTMVNSRAKLFFLYSDIKAGRGAAIRRSFHEFRSRFPEAEFFMEADSDGSHRPEDILNILNSSQESDLLIGSRYLNGSEIVGWTFSRRIMSKALNFTIPQLLGISAKDLTNGLRRYSRRAVDTILITEPKNSGFMYLSEIAYLLNSSKFSISETPIRFENRVYGTSTVGTRELYSSLKGLISLISLKKVKS